MFIGAAFWGASGTDLWHTLATGQMDSYLARANSVRSLLIANTSFWILGVLLMGSAGTIMSDLCTRNQTTARIALFCMRSGVPIAIVSFIIMLSLSLQIAPDTSPGAVSLATVLGWIGTNLDNVATILIAGAGPLFLSIAGYGEWVPRWLRTWGYLAGLSGLLAVLGIYVTSAIELLFVIIPFGLGWMIAAGVVLVKAGK
jgi:hypothetical protein